MRPTLGVVDAIGPDLRGARCFQDVHRAIDEELHRLEVILVTGGGDAHGGQAPGVLHLWVQVHRVGFHRQLRNEVHHRQPAVGLLDQRLFVAGAPTRRAMRARQTILHGRHLAARRHAAAAVPAAAFHVIGHIRQNRRAGDRALVLVQGISEEARSAAAIAGHQILADNAAGIGQPLREAVGLGEQQQAGGFRAVGRQHHAFRLLEDLLVVVGLVEIGHTRGLAAGVDIDLAHIGMNPDLAIAGRHRDRQQRHRRRRPRLDLAAIARAGAAIDAAAAPIIGLGDDGRDIRRHHQVELFRRLLNQRAGAFQGQRPARIRLGHRRDQGRLDIGPRNPDLPFRLGVIGLDLLIADRPVGNAGAFHGAELAGFIELIGQMPPA